MVGDAQKMKTVESPRTDSEYIIEQICPTDVRARLRGSNLRPDNEGTETVDRA